MCSVSKSLVPVFLRCKWKSCGGKWWHLSGNVTNILIWGTVRGRGRAIAQTVSRWLPTAAAWVWQVGFVVDKVALAQVFSEYFGFPCRSSFHQILHHHNHMGQVQQAIQWPMCRVDPVPPPLYEIINCRGQQEWNLVWAKWHYCSYCLRYNGLIEKCFSRPLNFSHWWYSVASLVSGSLHFCNFQSPNYYTSFRAVRQNLSDWTSGPCINKPKKIFY
jgi:hypothetical protein